MFSRDLARMMRILGNLRKQKRRETLSSMRVSVVFSTKTISILDSVVSKGEIKPDPDRLKRLQELPAPVDCLLITKKSSWVFF